MIELVRTDGLADGRTDGRTDRRMVVDCITELATAAGNIGSLLQPVRHRNQALLQCERRQVDTTFSSVDKPEVALILTSCSQSKTDPGFTSGNVHGSELQTCDR